MAMEPVKIGIPGVRDRQGGGQGAQRRKKKRRAAAEAAEPPGTEPEAHTPFVDPESEDENELWPEELRVGRHLNVVA